MDGDHISFSKTDTFRDDFQNATKKGQRKEKGSDDVNVYSKTKIIATVP